MEAKEYDVVIIGSGPGGYVAAIRAAQLGLKTAIIERYPTLGGTCLNVGCIPSKALLDSSEHYHNALHNFKAHGILVDNPRVDLATMIGRKDKVVEQTTQGIVFLMKKNKIDTYYGHGSFVDSHTVRVAPETGEAQELKAKNIIIATGSKPSSFPGIELDKKRIITSTEALKLTEIPGKLIVIGGGVIGLEMGSVYARLGTKVQVVEYADTLIPSMDRELGKEMQKILKKHLGFEFFFSHKVTTVVGDDTQGIVKAIDPSGVEQTFTADYVLVSVGRKPYTEGLNLAAAGLETDSRGRIEIDEHTLRTKVPHIYAIGDVIRGAMLAHKASDEGVFVAEVIAGQKPHINYRAIPGVVYTWPEVAAVGYTTEELQAAGIPFKSGKFPFSASGRARASMDTDGFVKVLAHKETDEVLGIHMIGPRAADMIAEAVVAYEYRASAEDIGIFSHAHPTFTESLKEAALAATGNRPLHI
jgi:dihydrolipoamide dehydrogenase